MHGISATQVVQFLIQGGSVLLVLGFTVSFARNVWIDDEMLDRFGRWHATPMARVCDACTWCRRQLKHPPRCATAIGHLLLTALVPVIAVLVSNIAAVKDAPIWFGLSGLVAGVLAEVPEGVARDAQYKDQNPPTKASIAVTGQQEPPKTRLRPKLKIRERFKDLHPNQIHARFTSLHPDQRVAAIAVPAAVFELLLGIGLFWGIYKTQFFPGHALKAVSLGVAFVAWAEAMSVISTMWLVKKGGEPFKP